MNTVARIRDIDHGSFSPLVFASTGGMDKDASVVVKKLASSIAEKTQQRYSDVVGLLRVHLSFVLLRAALLIAERFTLTCEKEKWRRRHPAGRAR